MKEPGSSGTVLLNRLQQIETGILVALLFAILFVSLADIVLRNLFSGGLVYAGPLVRTLVLWLGLLGALYATGQAKHITVNLLGTVGSDRFRYLCTGLGSGFSAVVCSAIAWFGYLFVRESYIYEDIAFEAVPAWITQLVIPLAFSLMSIRFLVYSVRDLRAAARA